MTLTNRYFICSIDDIEIFSRAVHQHWGIENCLHWHLDFTFKDDKNTTMNKNDAKNLQIVKKIVLSILRIVQTFYKVTKKVFLNFINSVRKSILDSFSCFLITF